MKKTTRIFCILLTLATLVGMMSIASFAAAAKNEKFDIPFAITPPVLDGVLSENEWLGALERKLTKDNVDDPTNSGLVCQGATFYWMWDDTGLYMAAVVTDNSPMADYHAPDAGSFNSKDGLQVNIYADATLTGSAVKKILFYSFCPNTTDGSAVIGEHFVYGDGGSGKNVPTSEAKIGAKYSKTGYTVEVWIGKESLAKCEPTITVKEGLVLPLANIIMDVDGSKQALFTDTAWFSGVEANKYTLTKAKTAGKPLAVETTAAAKPAAAKPAASAQTADFVVLPIVAAVISTGVLAVSKKRR